MSFAAQLSLRQNETRETGGHRPSRPSPAAKHQVEGLRREVLELYDKARSRCPRQPATEMKAAAGVNEGDRSGRAGEYVDLAVAQEWSDSVVGHAKVVTAEAVTERLTDALGCRGGYRRQGAVAFGHIRAVDEDFDLAKRLPVAVEELAPGRRPGDIGRRQRMDTAEDWNHPEIVGGGGQDRLA